MNNIEIPKVINRIIATFYKVGVWRYEDETVFREVTRKILYTVFYICFPISLVSGAYKTNNADESICLAVVAIASVVMFIRLLYVFWKKNEILAFIQEIGFHSIEDREDFIKINHKAKIFTNFISGFLIILIIDFFFLSCLPLPKRKLPLNIGFPLDWKSSSIEYFMTYIFIVCEMMLSFVSTFLTIIIWYLMFSFSLKYDALGSQFRNFGLITKITPGKKRKISEAEKQKLVFEELIGSIESHQKIKETISRFTSCFANLFFVQITTSSMGICGSIYAIVFTDDASLVQYEVSATSLIYNLFDILVVMYLGNEIKLSSNRLSYCLFEANWMEQSQSYKKCMIILCEVLKQPEEIVIAKLYPMDLETFTSILNLAYSMFNILQNIK